MTLIEVVGITHIPEAVDLVFPQPKAELGLERAGEREPSGFDFVSGTFIVQLPGLRFYQLSLPHWGYSGVKIFDHGDYVNVAVTWRGGFTCWLWPAKNFFKLSTDEQLEIVKEIERRTMCSRTTRTIRITPRGVIDTNNNYSIVLKVFNEPMIKEALKKYPRIREKLEKTPMIRKFILSKIPYADGKKQFNDVVNNVQIWLRAQGA